MYDFKEYTDEEWKDITNFENLYRLSNYGRVISSHTGKWKLLKTQYNGSGYACVILHKNNQIKMIRIHRLVAEYFIPNPENKPMVNHKDGNKANPVYTNLEWCTRSENEKHAWKMGLKRVTEKRSEASRKNLAIARSRRKCYVQI